MRVRFSQAALLLAVAACGMAPSQSGNAAAASGSAAQPAAAQSARPFSVTEVARFTSPWAMDFLPGRGVPMTNRALVSEREGRLWLIDVATGKRQPVGGIPRALVGGQGGLGEVVVHPDFARNYRVYLSFVEGGPNRTSGAAIGYGTLVFAGPAVPGGPTGAQLTNFKTIWRQAPKVTGQGHFAHRIVFARDGTMFVSSGEREKMRPAQDPASDLGKIIHLTAEGRPVPGGPWASRGGRAATYWTMGHRNVLGLAFAPDGRLWASEMGPQGGDELNLIERGKNYGWPVASYGSHYGGEAIPDNHAQRGFEEPKLWWNPAISPSGLLIYTGNLFRGWKGDALIPGLSGKALVRVDIDGARARKADQWDMGQRIRAVDQGPRGEIYLLEDGRGGNGGRLLRLEPRR